MFERLKSIFGGAAPAAAPPTITRLDSGRVSEWAQDQGYSYSPQALRGPDGKPAGEGFWVQGQTSGPGEGKSWRMECGLPSRDFIHGQELRGRADLGVLDAVSVVLMNRPLKVALEKRAYALYTDSLQTTVDPKLPEEMRWLAIYPEVGWTDLPNMFLQRYAVLAGKREHASSWITRDVAEALMRWPPSGPSAEVPFIMMLLRGKCYLRMEFAQGNLPTLAHAAKLFNQTCESALANVAQSVVPGSP